MRQVGLIFLGILALAGFTACSDAQKALGTLTDSTEKVDVSEEEINKAGCQYEKQEVDQLGKKVKIKNLDKLSCRDDGSIKTLRTQSLALKNYLDNIEKLLTTENINKDSKSNLEKKQSSAQFLYEKVNTSVALFDKDFISISQRWEKEDLLELSGKIWKSLEEESFCQDKGTHIDCKTPETLIDASYALTHLRNYQVVMIALDKLNKETQNTEDKLLIGKIEKAADVILRSYDDKEKLLVGSSRAEILSNILGLVIKNQYPNYGVFPGLSNPSETAMSMDQIRDYQEKRFSNYEQAFEAFSTLPPPKQLDLLLMGSIITNTAETSAYELSLQVGLTELLAIDLGEYVREMNKILTRIQTQHSGGFSGVSENRLNNLIETTKDIKDIVDYSVKQGNTPIIDDRTPFHAHIKNSLIKLRQHQMTHSCQVPMSTDFPLWSQNPFNQRWEKLIDLSVDGVETKYATAKGNTIFITNALADMKLTWNALKTAETELQQTLGSQYPEYRLYSFDQIMSHSLEIAEIVISLIEAESEKESDRLNHFLKETKEDKKYCKK